jgi:hypothetical protein
MVVSKRVDFVIQLVLYQVFVWTGYAVGYYRGLTIQHQEQVPPGVQCVLPVRE